MGRGAGIFPLRAESMSHVGLSYICLINDDKLHK